ncbi:flagellar hook assembly protein FlgD [Novilysobacter erysipheiresistens]|uniref:Basal-body rod modification protein FlgD n=1 Tax=Novilysobacter erysipheiresistens TaxID=1749332 RepID=A0ABU7Z095_9GAMM
MPVDAIGSPPPPQDAAITKQQTIDQEDFIKLFLAQLQFQDPLEPVDNREFLAQLAQFSSLEQSRQTSENTNDLLVMNAASQALGLLERQVDVQGLGAPVTGTVIAVQFTASGAQLSVRSAAGDVSTGIRLSQISLVKP